MPLIKVDLKDVREGRSYLLEYQHEMVPNSKKKGKFKCTWFSVSDDGDVSAIFNRDGDPHGVMCSSFDPPDRCKIYRDTAFDIEEEERAGRMGPRVSSLVQEDYTRIFRDEAAKRLNKLDRKMKDSSEFLLGESSFKPPFMSETRRSMQESRKRSRSRGGRRGGRSRKVKGGRNKI